MLNFRGSTLQNLQTSLILGFSFVSFGYNQAGVGSLTSDNSWTRTFPEIDTVHTTGQVKSDHATLQGLTIAVFTLGALVTTLLTSVINNSVSRKSIIYAGAAVSIIGGILQATAFTWAHFIVGRTILGMGIGFYSAAVPTWQSECSATKNRGQQVITTGVFMALGYALAAWIDFGFHHLQNSSVSWRAPVALPILLSVFVAILLPFFPESPRWLILKGRHEEAAHELSRLRDLPLDDPRLIQEVESIQRSLNQSTHDGKKEGENDGTETPASGVPAPAPRVYGNRAIHRLLLCLLIQFYQQMCGGNLISVYSTTLFKSYMHQSDSVSRILAASALTWKVFASFVGYLTIDRFGRRPIMMFSGGGMAICMFILAGTASQPDNKVANAFTALFLFLFNFVYPIGFLGANFVYVTELSPNHLRSVFTPLSVANHWLFQFLVQMITPLAIEEIAWRYFLVYGSVSACIPVTIFLLYPETMGMGLEQIDQCFAAPTVLHVPGYAAQMRKEMLAQNTSTAFPQDLA